MPLEAWIVDYVTAHFGKQDGSEPHWDKDKQRWVQIIGRVEKSKNKKTSNKSSTVLKLIISDSTTQIECKIVPKLLELHGGHSAFESNNVINLQTFDLRISCSFENIYFLLMDCSFLTALNVADIGKHKKSVPYINNNKNIQRLLNKYRVCQYTKFTLKDGEHEFDENDLPQSLHSAQQMNSFGFDNEINSLKQSYDDENNNCNNELQQIDDVDDYEIFELCKEDKITIIYTNSEDNDEDMIQDDNNNNNNISGQNIEINMDVNESEPEPELDTQNKKSSDKEEMEEDDEKQTIEVSKSPTKNTIKYIGNLCDWIQDLYPNFGDVPKELKMKTKELQKPIHTPCSQFRNKKRKQVPIIIQSPPKRQRIMQSSPIEHKNNEEANYSQISLTSSEILQCDEMVKEREKEKHNDIEFVKPIYSLTERIRNNNNNNGNGHENGVVNDSIISIQESIDSGGSNDIDIEESNKQMKEVNEGNDINEMNDLLNEMDVETNDNNIMNEPIDRDNLGEITRNDLVRICRYFVKKAGEMNRNNNNDPNNPFFVEEFDK